MSNVSQWDISAANNNATPPNGWPEGMQRSSVNDSGRENMAAVARWYSDMDGSLASAGTSGAYTLATNSAHAALADQSLLVFRAHVANAAGPTLDVDSLGAKTIKDAVGADLAAGVLALNQIVVVAYNATDDTYNLVGEVTPLTTEGDILYRGSGGLSRLAIGTASQVLVVNSGATAPEWADQVALTSGTSQATTSGTLKDFAIPAGAKQVTLSLAQVSTNGTNELTVRLGDSGGIETTGYQGAVQEFGEAGTPTTPEAHSSGFKLTTANAASRNWSGSITLTLIDSAMFRWAASGGLSRGDGPGSSFMSGHKQLTAELTTVRLGTTAGSDTFDAGVANVLYA